MRTSLGFLSIALITIVLPAALAGCQGPTPSCGEFPPDGGPAVITTKNQEMCESSRRRVLQYMETREDFQPAYAEGIWSKSERWEYEDTLAELIDRIRKDSDDDLAAAMQRAVDSAFASQRPLDPECEDEQECLVDSAAHGARLALMQRGYFLKYKRPDPNDRPRRDPSKTINIEDLIE